MSTRPAADDVPPALAHGGSTHRRKFVLSSLLVPSALLIAFFAVPSVEPLAKEERPPLTNILARSLQLTVTLSPIVIATPALLLPGGRVYVFEPAVAHALEQSGAAFIKLAQWASTRPDILPRTLCDALSRLHSSAPSHSFDATRAEVEAATGAPLESTFRVFEEKPVASGSIGQVHRAWLREDANLLLGRMKRSGAGSASSSSRQVAVKVRHPGVVLQMQTDFWLMGRLAAIVERIPGLGWLDTKALVGQFGASLSNQVYLNVEGEQLHRFGKHFRKWRDVGVPRLLLATESVLVESFASGRTVGSFTQQPGLARKSLTLSQRQYIVRRGVDIYLKMLLVDNLMHADLHPGNILFDPSGGNGQLPGRLSLVDFGLVTRLTSYEQRHFIGFLRALGDGDGHAAAQCVLSWHPNNAQRLDASAKASFATAMADSFATSCKGYHTGVDFGRVLRTILELVRVHGVAIEASYMTLVVNALCLEGLARELEPSYNVLDAGKPLLVASGILAAPSPLFRAALPGLQTLKRMGDARDARKADRTEELRTGVVESQHSR